MQPWPQHLKENVRQESVGFSNIAWLTESFTCLDSVSEKFDWLLVECQAAVSVLAS